MKKKMRTVTLHDFTGTVIKDVKVPLMNDDIPMIIIDDDKIYHHDIDDTRLFYFEVISVHRLKQKKEGGGWGQGGW